MTGLLSRLLDASVIASFDGRGYSRHARGFDPADLQVDLAERTVCVTGANSGIGFETASALAALGARVILLCRSPQRGQEARARILEQVDHERVELLLADLSDLDSVREAATRLRSAPLDVLVHNAGVLPSRRTRTPQALELTLATNLVGPFLLTSLLKEHLGRSADGRVVWVSSGGMYTVRLDVDALSDEEGAFDGVTRYAHTKRAMVVLTGMLQERWGTETLHFHAMHPGWADTPAVQSSLPRFHRITRKILRTPAQGADTVIWLAAAEPPRELPGRFWFDRRPVATTPLPRTSETAAERERLWEELHVWTHLRDQGHEP